MRVRGWWSRQFWGGLGLVGVLILQGSCGGQTTSVGSTRATPASSAAGSAPTAAAATPAAARDVRLAYASAATPFAPLWAAREYGLLQQNGLRATDLLLLDGGPLIAQALVAGELTGAIGAMSPMVAASMGGAEVKIVAGFSHGFVHQLFSRPGSGIAGPVDVRGKRAGVSRLGSEAHTVVRLWARQHGLGDDDITYVNVGNGGERLAALEMGSADFAPLDPPIVVAAEKRGYQRVADLTQEPVPWAGDGVVLLEPTLRNEPALALAVVRAVSEGAYLIRADHTRFDQVVSHYMQVDDPDALAAAYRAYVRGWSGRARPDPAGVRAVQEIVDETLPGTAREPASRFVELALLDQLEQEGFFDRLEQQYPAPAVP